jgi:hypothetical protein
MWVYSIRFVTKKALQPLFVVFLGAAIAWTTSASATAQKPPEQKDTSAVRSTAPVPANFASGQTAAAQVQAPAALSSEYGTETSDTTEVNTSSARRLFKEGVMEADLGRWEQASELFRRSMSLRPSPVSTYNLASAYGRVGRIVEASDLLRSVIWDGSATQNVRDVARSLLDSLMPQVGWLTIRVEGDPTSVTLTLDSHPLTLQRLGIALPMDPGRHVLGIAHYCSYYETRLINLQPGATHQEIVSFRTMSMPGYLSPPPDDSVYVKQPRVAATKAKTNILLNPWFWVGPGILVVGAIVTAIVWSSSSK